MPVRIQRKRTAGWRMPEGTVYVGRPNRWGNPFVVGTLVVDQDDPTRTHAMTVDECVDAFAAAVVGPRPAMYGVPSLAEIVDHLRSKSLACWCPIDQPCHADVLLRLANAPDYEGTDLFWGLRSSSTDATPKPEETS